MLLQPLLQHCPLLIQLLIGTTEFTVRLIKGVAKRGIHSQPTGGALHLDSHSCAAALQLFEFSTDICKTCSKESRRRPAVMVIVQQLQRPFLARQPRRKILSIHSGRRAGFSLASHPRNAPVSCWPLDSHRFHHSFRLPGQFSSWFPWTDQKPLKHP